MIAFSEFVRFILPVLLLLGFFLFKGQFFGFLFVLMCAGLFWLFWFKVLS